MMEKLLEQEAMLQENQKVRCFFFTTFNTLSFLHQVEGMGPEKEESLPSSFLLLLWSHWCLLAVVTL